MAESNEPFEDRVGNYNRKHHIAINDAVAGETVWTGSGNGNDGPTGGSPAESTAEYAPNDLARAEISLSDVSSIDFSGSDGQHRRAQPSTPVPTPGVYATYDAMLDDDDDSFDISLTDGPDLNAGDNIDTGAGRHRPRD